MTGAIPLGTGTGKCTGQFRMDDLKQINMIFLRELVDRGTKEVFDRARGDVFKLIDIEIFPRFLVVKDIESLAIAEGRGKMNKEHDWATARGRGMRGRKGGDEFVAVAEGLSAEEAGMEHLLRGGGGGVKLHYQNFRSGGDISLVLPSWHCGC